MKFLSYLVLGTICLGIGWSIGYFGRLWLTIEFKKEVGLVDLIQIGIAVIFAFALQNYLTKRFGDQRSEKEHMIGLITEQIGMVKEVRTHFIKVYQTRRKISASGQREILNALRNLANGMDNFKECMNKCNYSKADNGKIESLTTKYLDLKRTITGGKFPSSPYSGETFSDAEKLFSQMNSSLHLLRIDLNKK